MSDAIGKGELTLRCPVCAGRFSVSPEGRGPHNVLVACTACGHDFTPEEMVKAMSDSLNELIELARKRFTEMKF